MSRFALQARWVLPIDRPPIAGGVVTVCDGRLESVGDRPAADAIVRDLGEVVLMPGLVNTHTHLEFSGLDEPLGHPGMSLPTWIRLVIATRGRSQSAPDKTIEAGLRESGLAGVTTLGEIATGALNYQSADDFPTVLAFQEVIGFSSARIDSVLADVEQRLEPKGPLMGSQGISPHAPYTVHPQLVERLVELACRRKIPITMHLAESTEELELLESRSGPFRELLEERSMWDQEAIPRGTKPLDYLEMLAKAPRAIAIHGNYFSAKEIGYLAAKRQRMSVVYCPRTHAFFQHSEYPLSQMLAAGVRVALGTDSRASNPDLSLLGEMRYVATHHPQVAPRQILELGTLAGAQAIGRDDEIGSLTPGKWADLIAIPCDKNCSEPEASVLHSNGAPTKTWLQGKALVL